MEKAQSDSLLNVLRRTAKSARQERAEKAQQTIETELEKHGLKECYCGNKVIDAIRLIENDLKFMASGESRSILYSFHLTHVECTIDKVTTVINFPHWPAVILSETTFNFFVESAVANIKKAFIDAHPEFEKLICIHGNSKIKIVWNE